MDSTRELYAALSLDDVPLSPSLTILWDVDEAEGFYINFGISQGVELIEEKLEAELAFSTAFATDDYNEFYFGSDDADLNDGNVSLGLTYNCSDHFHVGASIAYSWFWEDDIEDAADALYDDDDQLYGGVHIVKSWG